MEYFVEIQAGVLGNNDIEDYPNTVRFTPRYLVYVAHLGTTLQMATAAVVRLRSSCEPQVVSQCTKALVDKTHE
jgi:hypothetical protein